MQKWLFTICNHPLYAVAVTVISVIAGLLGSIYTDAIKQSFPFNVGPQAEFAPHAVWFWIVVTIFAALFFGRQWATDRSVLEAQNNLIKQSSSLESLIKTLPPEGFLSKWSKRYGDSRTVARKALNVKSITADQVEEAIRLVLQHIVFLGMEFDGVPGSTRYAANIMIYRDSVGLSQIETDRLSGLLKFFDRDPSAIQGYLELVAVLSVASDTEDQAVDANIDTFALPVEKLEVSEHGKFRQLPGAPLTFWQNGPSHFGDATQLSSWCATYGDFSDTVVQAVRSYFSSERAQRIKSFVSIPIPNPKQPATNRPLAVLNMHRNQTNMLRGADAFKLFFPLVSPFTAIIGELLISRERALEAKSVPGT